MSSDEQPDSGPSPTERIRSLQESLSRDPSDVPARLELARQLMKRAAEHADEAVSAQQIPAFEEAVHAVEEALLCDPANLIALRLLAEAYMGLAGSQSAHEIDPDAAARSAMRALETLIRRRPFDPEPYRRFAWCSFGLGMYRMQHGLESRGQFMKAAEAQVQAMVLDPTYMVDTHMLRLFHSTLLTVEHKWGGESPPEADDFRAAPERVWRREVRRAPKDPDVRARLGIVQLSNSLHGSDSPPPQRALRTFARALELERDHFGALFGIGATYRTMGEERERFNENPVRCYRAAVTALRRAARVQPEHQRVWVELARSALKLGQLGRFKFGRCVWALHIARGACERALEIDPEDAETHTLLGECVFNLGLQLELAHREPRSAFEEAARIHAEGMRREPEKTEHLWRHAVALEWLAKAASRRSDDPRTEYRRAICAFETLIERDPKQFGAADTLAEMRFELAKAQAKAGDDAAAAFAKALDFHIERVRGEPKDALRCYQLAVVGQAYGDWLASRGEDPQGPYEIAIRALEAPGEHYLIREGGLDEIGAMRLSLARWQAAHGRDARAAYLAAIDAQRRKAARPVAPTWWRIEQTAPLGEFVRWLHAGGADFGEPLGEWVQLLEELTRYPFPWSGLGDGWLDLAAFEAARGGDPQPALGQAVGVFRALLDRPHPDASAHMGLAEAHIFEAALVRARGEDYRALLRAAVRECDEVPLRRRTRRARRRYDFEDGMRLTILGSTMRALRIKGEALLALGRFAAARRCLDRALAIQPEDARIKGLLERARGERGGGA